MFPDFGPPAAQGQVSQDLANALLVLAAIGVTAQSNGGGRTISLREKVSGLQGYGHPNMTNPLARLEHQQPSKWQYGSDPFSMSAFRHSSQGEPGKAELMMDGVPQVPWLEGGRNTTTSYAPVHQHPTQVCRADMRCLDLDIEEGNRRIGTCSANDIMRKIPLPDVESWHTTLVVRNIPARCTHERLLQQWPNNGSYNFLFVPYSVKQRRASRYMFINFTSHENMVAFMIQWHGAWLPDVGFGPKLAEPLEMRPAKMQGLRANVWHHKSTATCRHRPAVFQNGHRVDFCQLLEQLGIDGSDSGDGTSQDTDSDDATRVSSVGLEWPLSSSRSRNVDRPMSLILSF